jgi:RNA polymerase primary sigma factor
MLHWEQKQGGFSAHKGRNARMSSTALATDTRQQTVHQSASATRIRVEDHLGLVMHLAKRYAGSYQGQHLLDLEDLYQEGVLGLLHAAEKFDARKGFRFSTYATHWIRWAIGQAIMHESRTMRLPTTIWSALHHLARAQTVLWQQYQREPSLDELATVMQCAKEQVLVLLHLQHEPVSLEQPVYAEQEATLVGDQLAAPDNSKQREQQREVTELLKHLSPRERQVIQTRYQLGPTGAYNVEDIPLPYTEVSRQLGMTTGLVKAIETRALIKLRFWAERSPYVPSG